ncbi:MAG: hypothetical protein HXY27_04155 [Hydrogenophilaceae bacterium]|nr:hypothetical protein [Hydrogenophilaceae bacterium]
MSYSAVRPEPPHNNRCSYQTGNCPSFIVGFGLAALLLGVSSLSHAGQADLSQTSRKGSAVFIQSIGLVQTAEP